MPSITPRFEAQIIIGLDPHPTSFTAAALDQNGRLLAHLTIPNTPYGHEQLWQWAQQFNERHWAIEGAGNAYVHALVTRLVTAGETITNISPNLTAQYRSRRGRKKTDEIDAANAARALLANPELTPYQQTEAQRELQELSRSHQRLSAQLKAHRLSLRESRTEVIMAELQRLISVLEAALERLKARMAQLVQGVMPELLAVRGVGPILGAVLLAEAGDVTRFKTRDQFAAFGGCAPVARESGYQQQVRVNTRGNRRINWAVYLIIRTRLSMDEATRAYMRKKLAEGKTKREAWRCLKTLVARELFGVMKRAVRARSEFIPPRLGVCH